MDINELDDLIVSTYASCLRKKGYTKEAEGVEKKYAVIKLHKMTNEPMYKEGWKNGK